MEGAESKNLLQGRFALWHHVIQQILDQSRTRIGFLSSNLSPAAAASWDLPLGRLKNTRRMQSSCSASPRELLMFFNRAASTSGVIKERNGTCAWVKKLQGQNLFVHAMKIIKGHSIGTP